MPRARLSLAVAAALAGCIAPSSALKDVERRFERARDDVQAVVDVGEPRPVDDRVVRVSLRGGDRRGWKGALVRRAREVFKDRVDLRAAPWEWRVDVWLLRDAPIAYELVRVFEPDDPLIAALHDDGRWYDEDGYALEGPCRARALDYAYVSSLRGPRIHPITGRHRFHHGTDFAAAIGTPVVAIADGVVERVAHHRSKGLHVVVRHDNGMVAKYLHLDGVPAGTLSPKRVKKGDVVGHVGMSGLATGPHLHLELTWKGAALDPTTMRWPAGKPLHGAALDAHRARLAALRETPGDV